MLDVIDLSGLGSRDPATVRRVAAELGQACRDVGFFYVRHHGVSDALLSGIFRCSEALFAAPRAAKEELAITRSRHNRGYVGIASESLNLAQADLKEAFNIGLDLPPSDPEVVANKPFRGVNFWPRMPGFRETALGYFDALWQLGLDLHLRHRRRLGTCADFLRRQVRSTNGNAPAVALPAARVQPRRPSRRGRAH